jgi:urease accessory protein UreH
VQKHLYAEGPEVCQHIIVHPPGGIAGGDRLDISASVGTDAWAQITSPGAAKWYRAAGPAYQTLDLKVAAGATLEWLPQETIVFSAARLNSALGLTLKATPGCSTGTWLHWDVRPVASDSTSGIFRRTWTFAATAKLALARAPAHCR